MTTQLDFSPARQNTPTSRAAAERIRPQAYTLRRQVLDAIVRLGGATDEQIQDHLEMDPSTERPRRVELVNSGVVRDSGRTALTSSGRKAIVWEVV